MIATNILMNIVSASIKQTIFYVFNLLNRSQVKPLSKSQFHYDDPEVQEETIELDADIEPTENKYSLRERKPVNYKF